MQHVHDLFDLFLRLCGWYCIACFRHFPRFWIMHNLFTWILSPLVYLYTACSFNFVLIIFIFNLYIWCYWNWNVTALITSATDVPMLVCALIVLFSCNVKTWPCRGSVSSTQSWAAQLQENRIFLWSQKVSALLHHLRYQHGIYANMICAL